MTRSRPTTGEADRRHNLEDIPMHGVQLAGIVRPDALAYEALEGVLKAHASLDALTTQSPEELRERIRNVIASIARSAREIDDIVRLIDVSPSPRQDITIEERAELFAENDVEDLVESLPGTQLPCSRIVRTLRGI